MIIATTTEHGTEEDTELSSRVTRSVVDNYMRRPSLEDKAIRTIAAMANNDLSMMSSIEEGIALCDAAFIFLQQNKGRFLIAGSSAAWHFENGKLQHRSLSEDAPLIGLGPRYEARLEPIFELRQEDNAFLVGSASLAQRFSDRELEETLKDSATAEEWMERLKSIIGSERQFCAITAFLAAERPPFLKRLFVRP